MRTATQPPTVSYVIPSDGHGPDTYWDIAEARLGGGDHWQQIWDLNRGRTQPDGEVMNSPGLLKPGWTVLLPATATPPAAGPHVEDVTVHEGDTLSGIAQAHGVSDWHQVWDASKGMAEPSGQHLTDPDLIRPGWTVKIPESAHDADDHDDRHRTPDTTPTTRRRTNRHRRPLSRRQASRHRRRSSQRPRPHPAPSSTTAQQRAGLLAVLRRRRWWPSPAAACCWQACRWPRLSATGGGSSGGGILVGPSGQRRRSCNVSSARCCRRAPLGWPT